MRKGTSTLQPSTIAGCVAFFLVAALAVYFWQIRPSDPFGNLEKLDAVSYSESAKSFQGGVYLVEGTLDDMLDATSTQGRLVTLVVSSSRGAIPIPVLVPQNLGSFNLQKGQALKIKVKGINRGLLKAEKIEKST